MKLTKLFLLGIIFTVMLSRLYANEADTPADVVEESNPVESSQKELTPEELAELNSIVEYIRSVGQSVKGFVVIESSEMKRIEKELEVVSTQLLTSLSAWVTFYSLSEEYNMATANAPRQGNDYSEATANVITAYYNAGDEYDDVLLGYYHEYGLQEQYKEKFDKIESEINTAIANGAYDNDLQLTLTSYVGSKKSAKQSQVAYDSADQIGKVEAEKALKIANTNAERITTKTIASIDSKIIKEVNSAQTARATADEIIMTMNIFLYNTKLNNKTSTQ